MAATTLHECTHTARESLKLPLSLCLFDQASCHAQKFQNSGRLGKEFGATVPVTRTLLEAQKHNTIKEKSVSNAQRCEAWTANAMHTEIENGPAWPSFHLPTGILIHLFLILALRFFEETMRSNAENPNTLLSSLHLRRYTEEMYRQEQAAKSARVHDSSLMASQRATFRSSLLTKMEGARGDKMKKLQRDDAVHATLLKHKVWMGSMPSVSEGLFEQAWARILPMASASSSNGRPS